MNALTKYLIGLLVVSVASTGCSTKFDAERSALKDTSYIKRENKRMMKKKGYFQRKNKRSVNMVNR